MRKHANALLALVLSAALAGCGNGGRSSTTDNGTTDRGATDSDITDPGTVAFPRPWSKAARFFGKQHKPLVHDHGGSEVAEKTGFIHPTSMAARPCIHVSPIKSVCYP